MTHLEQKLTIYLLQKLADILSHQGCNDFDLYKAGLSDDEARELVDTLNEWDRVHNPVGFEPRRPNTHIVEDWLLAHMLADKLANTETITP